MALHSVAKQNIGKNSPILPDKEALLEQSYLEAYKTNFESVQRWTKWKNDLHEVKKSLKTLPNKLSHDVIIPFGSKALVKAKLVHTNEVLTCVGESWFIKQSANQAVEMCDRRINQSEMMLEKLKKEKELLTSRQTLPAMYEAFPKDTQEIIEVYDEEKESQWKEKHREREKEYRQQLAELKKKEGKEIDSEEALFRRLEELELQEELNDELNRLGLGDEEDEGDVDDDDYESYETEEDNDAEDESSDVDEKEDNQEKSTDKRTNNKSLLNESVCSDKSTITIDGRKHIKALSHNATFDSDDNLENRPLDIVVSNLNKSSSEGQLSSLAKATRRISFADQVLILNKEKTDTNDENEYVNDIYIRFKHTEVQSCTSKRSHSTSSFEKNVPELKSPSNIYDFQKFLVRKVQPKSILKKSSSLPQTSAADTVDVQQSLKPFGSSFGINFDDSDGEINDPISAREFPQVLSDVKENVAPVCAPAEPSNQRPMSRFRAARQYANKKEGNKH